MKLKYYIFLNVYISPLTWILMKKISTQTLKLILFQKCFLTFIDQHQNSDKVKKKLSYSALWIICYYCLLKFVHVAVYLFITLKDETKEYPKIAKAHKLLQPHQDVRSKSHLDVMAFS